MSLSQRYRQLRARSEALAGSLSAEDQQLQGFDYASPTKWHLAHTTWFFETFVLRTFSGQPRLAPDGWAHLFNSYYEGAGSRHPRPLRGLLSRPALDQILAWRRDVDEQVLALLAHDASPELVALCRLGVTHEEQHQELMLTDILANFSLNPTNPAWRTQDVPVSPAAPSPLWHALDGGLVEIGTYGSAVDAAGFPSADFSSADFSFDNERPRHRTWLEPFALRRGLVSNAEVVAFIEDGGYGQPGLWLSDGIAWVRAQGIAAPAYWQLGSDGWTTLSLYGRGPLDLAAPATHLSAYEADAIATWLGARLPTEQEWEHAAVTVGGAPESGRWQGDGPTRPQHPAGATGPLVGLWGEVWEWTRSSYLPYPGYQPLPGAVGEYNGKFMSGQWVLRGGSCATAPGHARATYRNFFYPAQRWQFTGIRLAR